MDDHIESSVREFLSDHVGVGLERIRCSTTLLGDLGVDGDDGYDLLSDFAEQFAVDMTAFEFDRHFAPEGLPPWFPFYWLILLFRRGTPEQRARLEPISVADLVDAANRRAWQYQ